MTTSCVRAFATALAISAAGAAFADKVTTLDGLKKDAALPAGQAALLIVLDQGTQGSAVKRPKPVTMELVAVADGARYRVTDAAQADVLVAPPGKYFVKDVYNMDRSLEARDIHTAAEAFELKPGVLNYAGSWKFGNNSSRTTGTVSLEFEFAKPALDGALRRHPQFAAKEMIWLAAFGKPTVMLGAEAPAEEKKTTPTAKTN